MHEVSLAKAIVDHISEMGKNENFSTVKSLTLSIGKMSGVDKECMEFCFEPSVKGTILENAKLILEEVPLTLHCNMCDKISYPEVMALVCQSCLSTDVDVTGGDKFLIKSIDV